MLPEATISEHDATYRPGIGEIRLDAVFPDTNYELDGVVTTSDDATDIALFLSFLLSHPFISLACRSINLFLLAPCAYSLHEAPGIRLFAPLGIGLSSFSFRGPAPPSAPPISPSWASPKPTGS